jgi:anti-sigma B factor antagonist
VATTQLQARVRSSDGAVAVIELKGDVTAASESELMDAYRQAGPEETRGIVLDFTGLDYMNSSGIGLLVTLLVRAKRQHQSIMAFGLSDHYRQIFQLTRLDDAISIHDDEDQAVSAAGS